MKQFKTFIFLLFGLIIASCSNEETNETMKQEKLANELRLAHQELKNDLDYRENPISNMLSDYAKSSKISEHDLRDDLELSYKTMTYRIKLIANGKLSNQAYYNDMNGAFETKSGFKTELGKEISLYYKEKYLNRLEKRNSMNQKQVENFKKMRELRKNQIIIDSFF